MQRCKRLTNHHCNLGSEMKALPPERMQAISVLIADVMLGSYLVYWCTPKKLHPYLMGQQETWHERCILSKSAPHKTATTAIFIQRYSQREARRDGIGSSSVVPTSKHKSTDEAAAGSWGIQTLPCRLCIAANSLDKCIFVQSKEMVHPSVPRRHWGFPPPSPHWRTGTGPSPGGQTGTFLLWSSQSPATYCRFPKDRSSWGSESPSSLKMTPDPQILLAGIPPCSLYTDGLQPRNYSFLKKEMTPNVFFRLSSLEMDEIQSPNMKQISSYSTYFGK